MGSHCIDVVCVGCGKHFCLRGSCLYADKSEFNAKEASKYLAKGGHSYGKKCCDVCVPDSCIMGKKDPKENK